MRTTSRPWLVTPAAKAAASFGELSRMSWPITTCRALLGAHQPRECGADLGSQRLVDLFADQPPNVVSLDDTVDSRGGPTHARPPDDMDFFDSSPSAYRPEEAARFAASPARDATSPRDRAKPADAHAAARNAARAARAHRRSARWRVLPHGGRGRWKPGNEARSPVKPCTLGPGAPACETRSAPSRTASARATSSSSSSGWVGSGPAWRTSSHPRGAVMRPAWPTHRSHEWGSRAVASGPTTAVESE